MSTPAGETQALRQDCLELLLAAGYFRARVTSLAFFDRIVGGLTWAITGSNADLGSLDADDLLLFRENLSIGQKM
jgi:hypothetical protein